MINLLLSFTILVTLSACSYSKPKNAWQHQSANNFSEYTKHFLGDKKALAKSDLSRAVSNAKKSANLNTLARVYLGECALNISIGIEDKCSKYENIEGLVQDKELQEYYFYITGSLKKDECSLEDLFELENVKSQLLCASLIKNKLSKSDMKMLIETSSFHGYKSAVLFWLEQSKKYASDTELKKINKTIKILQN